MCRQLRVQTSEMVDVVTSNCSAMMRHFMPLARSSRIRITFASVSFASGCVEPGLDLAAWLDRLFSSLSLMLSACVPKNR